MKKTSLLEISDVSCKYGSDIVVSNVSLVVKEGSQVCLLGPSGCGKTTILRAIAGFNYLIDGNIVINGKKVSSKTIHVRPELRQVGMVFQDNALFPNMSVRENIESGLRKISNPEKIKIVDELMERMHIEDQANRFPHQLSGGQQQRVALARALAPKPILLLMDEPFSNLDFDLREQMGLEISELLKENNITCIMVTHDQNDAFALGDEVGVMNQGSIVQWDTPYNLYHKPISRFVADFIGNGTFLPGILASQSIVETELGSLASPVSLSFEIGTELDILLRPDDLVLDSSGDINATVKRKAFKGADILYTLSTNHTNDLLALFPSHTNINLGEPVRLTLKAEHVVAFPRLANKVI
tara:strand:+ start:1294 stop:2361 length:1068 start_codon:yes stop_codon:yes gene_type:complete